MFIYTNTSACGWIKLHETEQIHKCEQVMDDITALFVFLGGLLSKKIQHCQNKSAVKRTLTDKEKEAECSRRSLGSFLPEFTQMHTYFLKGQTISPST